MNEVLYCLDEYNPVFSNLSSSWSYSTSVNSYRVDNDTEVKELKEEIKKLKKCMAYLNTRVNHLIAEKQMSENGNN